MTANELREELETELAWRQEEIAFFKKQLNEIAENNKKRIIRHELRQKIKNQNQRILLLSLLNTIHQ